MLVQADILVWDFKTQQLVYRCTQHKSKVQSVCFTANEKFLVSLGGVDDQSVLVWDLATGKPGLLRV
jgi:cilia- and flagella-associated protein 52